MEEEQLRQLIASLCILSKEGSIPLNTISVLVNSAPCEKLAYHLHQRWLSEQNFAKIAAHIILQRQHMYETDLGLFSCCLAHILSDFRSRHQIRKGNKLVFRNIVRAILNFYPVYREIDATVSECLVEPMFTSLEELINDDADERDIETAAELIIDHGDTVLRIRPGKCDSFIVALRIHLCESDLKPVTRRLILQAIDLWTYRWDSEIMPFCIKQFYEPSMQFTKNPKEALKIPSESKKKESVI
uniref:THUMP domain-containing protein n=1 Tax=Loa loa TaxID=7209 RepID=A0A1I7VUC7_LOALO